MGTGSSQVQNIGCVQPMMVVVLVDTGRGAVLVLLYDFYIITVVSAWGMRISNGTPRYLTGVRRNILPSMKN
jgi:hypothetical protein